MLHTVYTEWREKGRDPEGELIMNYFHMLRFYNFVMQMKFSQGNIYFNNISNSYITILYFKNDCIMNYICIKDFFFIFEILTFYGTSYFCDIFLSKLG